jgi:DNA-binding MarR family transcriptional regulator
LSFEQELLIDLLREVNRDIGEEVRKVMSKYDFSITTMMIVRQIKAEPGITISELARRTGIAKSHISNTIKELSLRGWVEIETDSSDQRRLRINLSQSATEQLKIVRAAIRQHLSSLLSGISELRCAEIIDSIRDIQKALGQTKEREQYHD